MADTDTEEIDIATSLQDLGIHSHRMWGMPIIRVVNKDNGEQKHRFWLSKLNDWWIR